MAQIPLPFPVRPGQRLRVNEDKPFGSDLMKNDIVTVMDVAIKVVGQVPLPVVIVSTGYGPQQLPFSVLVPISDEDLPTYSPAEPDEIVDAFFSKILTNALTDDDELRAAFIDGKTKLAANDKKEGQEPEVHGGGTSVAEKEKESDEHPVGESYTYEEPQSGDELEVVYVEQTCPTHGREGGFYIIVNDEDSVFIPAEGVEGLIKYLFSRRNHSRRPPEAE